MDTEQILKNIAKETGNPTPKIREANIDEIFEIREEGCEIDSVKALLKYAEPELDKSYRIEYDYGDPELDRIGRDRDIEVYLVRDLGSDEIKRNDLTLKHIHEVKAKFMELNLGEEEPQDIFSIRIIGDILANLKKVYDKLSSYQVQDSK